MGDSSCFYSPFEIAGAIEETMEGEDECMGDEPSMIRAVMKRMNYERKISASLYALNGISECLKLKKINEDATGGGRGVFADHLSNLSNACKKQQEEEVKKRRESVQRPQNPEPSSSSSSETSLFSSSASVSGSGSSNDGELSLWSSLDLPPICYVT